MKHLLLSLSLALISFSSHSGVKPRELHQLRDKLFKIYEMEIESRGAQLEIAFLHESSNVGAFAKNEPQKNWQITVHGGLIRHPKMNYSAMGLILCHEMGHFLGGAPYVTGRQMTPTFITRAPKNMSAEGQADFFATADCGKKLFKDDSWDEEVNDLPKGAAEFCRNQDMEENLCLRLLKTSKRVIDIYTDIVSTIDGFRYREVSYFSKDTSVTDRTLVYVGEYPGLQCRLDTMLAGISYNRGIQQEELRPACWFRPE